MAYSAFLKSGISGTGQTLDAVVPGRRVLSCVLMQDGIFYCINDVFAGPDAIGAFHRAAEREKFGVESPTLLESENDYDFNGFSGEKVRRMVGAVRMGKFHGVCFAIHRNVISEIRFPDTDKKPVHPKLNIKTSWGKKKSRSR